MLTDPRYRKSRFRLSPRKSLFPRALRALAQTVLRRAMPVLEPDVRPRVRPLSESRINRRGLPAGTTAPVFELPDLTGRLRSLLEFRGKRVLLVFTDPSCVPCDALAPDLVSLHERRGEEFAILMVSRGDHAANVAKAKEHGYTFPVLVQEGWRISKQYGIFATPVGYLINEAGLTEKRVAAGPPSILGLVENRER